MPRSLTLPAIRESQREHGTDVFLTLLVVDTLIVGPDQYIFLVNNTENITSNGKTFIACPFEISLPDTNDYTTESAQIRIDNVDPRIWTGMRMLNEAAWVSLSIVLASDPNTVVLYSGNLRFREADATNTVISAKLIVDNVWRIGFPRHDFDPSQNPGMFT